MSKKKLVIKISANYFVAINKLVLKFMHRGRILINHIFKTKIKSMCQHLLLNYIAQDSQLDQWNILESQMNQYK